MADVLKVTPEELQATANQFKTYQGNLQTAYLTMSDAVRVQHQEPVSAWETETIRQNDGIKKERQHHGRRIESNT